MSKELTDKWKNGELPSGYYYLTNGEETYIHECLKTIHKIVPSRFTFLAPVPSYDEYRELLDLNVYEKDRKKVMGLENKVKRLREQLEIAKKALKEYADSSNWYETDDFGISAVDQFACDDYGYNIAKEALKEMEGVK